MNYYDFAITVLSSATVSTLLAGALVWLSKTWIGARLQGAIRAEYDAKLETHKAHLKAQSDVELERLKSSLALSAAEHSETFTRLHERRVKAIAKTYALLRTLHGKVAAYTAIFEDSGTPPRAQRFEEARQAFNVFAPYFVQHRIFFPKPLATLVDKLKQDLHGIIVRFSIRVDGQQGAQKEWIAIDEQLEGEFQQALEALEDAMRVALGDKSSLPA